MATVIRIALVILIILTVMTQDVSVRYRRSDTTTVDIDMTILALTLTDKKGDKARKPKKKRKKLSQRLESIPALFRGISFLLKRSDVEIHSLSIPSDKDDSPFRRLPFYVSLPSLLVYLKSKARRFSLDRHYGESGEIDVKISFTLFHLFISLLTVQYYIMKRKFSS